MRIKNLYGKEVNKSFSKYAINWDRKVSKPQKRIKDIIRPYWEGQDVYEELLIPSSRLRVDLVNFTLNIAIEVSPSQHTSYNKFFHKSYAGFNSSIDRDKDKYSWLKLNKIDVVELFEDDLKLSDGEILDLIL